MGRPKLGQRRQGAVSFGCPECAFGAVAVNDDWHTRWGVADCYAGMIGCGVFPPCRPRRKRLHANVADNRRTEFPLWCHGFTPRLADGLARATTYQPVQVKGYLVSDGAPAEGSVNCAGYRIASSIP